MIILEEHVFHVTPVAQTVLQALLILLKDVINVPKDLIKMPIMEIVKCHALVLSMLLSDLMEFNTAHVKIAQQIA